MFGTIGVRRKAALRAALSTSSRRLRWLAALAIGVVTLQVVGAGPVFAAPGDVTEFALSPSTSPYGITTGPDGNLWFTEFTANRIGRITPDGVVTEFATGITAGSNPQEITAGPDGNVWFTEFYGNLGRITPGGTITEYATGVTLNSQPDGITAGPDGNLWFTEIYGDRIGRITPAGIVTEYSTGITPGSAPEGITAGPDGNVWFTEYERDRIGRITPAGIITEYAIIPNSEPEEITAGPDGNLWFTEAQGDRIGRITPGGVVTEYSTGITPGGFPTRITSGPDGNVWFAELIGSRIGRLELPAPAASITPGGHDFGDRALASTSGPRQFTVTNTGTAPLIVGSAGITGANTGDFAATDDQCSGVTVAPGDACTISVTFTPAVVGPRSAALSVPDNAAGSPHTAALTGTGTRAASAVLLTSSPNPSGFGDPLTLTAHVSSVAPVAPTGSVTFSDGAAALGSAPVDATGAATLATSALHAGTHQITASYSGDTNLLASSATTVQQVNPAATTLTAKPAQVAVQLPGTSGLRLSARLSVTSTGAPVAGQSVSMAVDGTTVCTATTATDGLAACTAPLTYLLGVTLHGYTATYVGSADYQPATGHGGLLG